MWQRRVWEGNQCLNKFIKIKGKRNSRQSKTVNQMQENWNSIEITKKWKENKKKKNKKSNDKNKCKNLEELKKKKSI